VGGIAEQVIDLAETGPERATGMLSPPGDAGALAHNAQTMLEDDQLRSRLGVNAEREAARAYDVNNQAKAYLGWYEEILDRRSTTGQERESMKHGARHE
jgi:glycosyltransferase involved in cell wall biosynthesis